MTNLTSLAGRLSVLDLRSRLGKGARPRRSRRDRRFQVAAEVAPLEQRCLMSSHVLDAHALIVRPRHGHAADGAPTSIVQDVPAFPQMPTGTTTDPGVVMHQSNREKTVKITNATSATIYPILEGENSKGALYDTFDTPPNQEYRVYVGYSQGGVNYFGLQAGQSITVRIPQAIWDSGRLNIVANTPELAQTFESPKLPFLFQPTAVTCVQTIPNSNGVMFLYHDKTPLVIGADAPSQLVEWSVRDKTITPADGNSVDYDLSYLDHMYLPVAVEAVPGTGKPKVGYIGTTLSTDPTMANMQSTLQKFVNGSLLNGYFGGQGWPQYDLGSTNPNDPIKIPGGYNIFALSASTSSYNINVPMLTSSQQTSVTPAANNNYAAQAITNLFFSWANFYQQMWADPAKYHPPGKEIPAAPGSTLAQFMIPAAGNPDSIQAQDNVQPFQIRYNATGKYDLAHAEAFATLVWKAFWTFSQDTTSVSPAARFITSKATLTANTNPAYPFGNRVLTGVSPAVLAAIEGQKGGATSTPVVGTGIPQRDNIYAIDGNNIILLQPASTPVGQSNTYRFYYYPPTDAQPELQATSQLVGAVLGDSIGDFEKIGGNNWEGKPWSDNTVRQQFTEDVIKPIMYGVTTPADEKDENIPAPGDPKTDVAAQFNVDPLVWLVHTAANWENKQRIFAYAFSVDDEYGNVLIPDSTGMEVSVGGDAGLTDKKSYNAQNPKPK